MNKINYKILMKTINYKQMKIHYFLAYMKVNLKKKIYWIPSLNF